MVVVAADEVPNPSSIVEVVKVLAYTQSVRTSHLTFKTLGLRQQLQQPRFNYCEYPD